MVDSCSYARQIIYTSWSYVPARVLFSLTLATVMPLYPVRLVCPSMPAWFGYMVLNKCPIGLGWIQLFITSCFDGVPPSSFTIIKVLMLWSADAYESTTYNALRPTKRKSYAIFMASRFASSCSMRRYPLLLS